MALDLSDEDALLLNTIAGHLEDALSDGVDISGVPFPVGDASILALAGYPDFDTALQDTLKDLNL